MTRIVIAVVTILAGAAQVATAQTTDPGAPSPAAAAAMQTAPSDRAVDPSEPDFTLIGLPTTLRMPKFASAFRVTHRFTRSLGQGNFGDLLADGFGTDGGAQIGLEYRFGILAGTQVAVHRTSDKTIQFLGQQNVLRQSQGAPLGLDIVASIEGRDNFQETYSPSIGAVVSRKLGVHGAIYFQPIWVGNTDFFDLSDDDNTVIFGVGTRVRLASKLYVVAEVAPRVGYDPGVMHGSFAVEMRAGGHSFQINFSDGWGTTMAQLARGGFDSDNWYLGFNISRKFF
jgi:hypothetical protein